MSDRTTVIIQDATTVFTKDATVVVASDTAGPQGPAGPTGISIGPTPPLDTAILWVDTS